MKKNGPKVGLLLLAIFLTVLAYQEYLYNFYKKVFFILSEALENEGSVATIFTTKLTLFCKAKGMRKCCAASPLAFQF